MDQELKLFFYRLYDEDYDLIENICKKLDEDSLWQSTPEGVSLANLICHTCEMEAFWIDWGLCGQEFDRNRQHEFDRFKDVDKNGLIALIQSRREKTKKQIELLTLKQWQLKRKFHGDDFTGKGILLWHLHHIGLHRGHIQAHARWLKKTNT